MTLQEFSLEFDILYNNIKSQSAPGLDEYEKSVLLTDAQESLVLDIYEGRNDKKESFEETESKPTYRDWETDRKSTRLNSSHSAKSRMPSSA